MKTNLVELTDEQAYAIENGEEIEGCISEPTYKYHCMDDLYEELHRIGLSKDFSENDIKRYEKAEERLRFAESEIIRLIGQKSFWVILEVIDLQKKLLREDIKKSLDSYHDLDQYIKKLKTHLGNP